MYIKKIKQAGNFLIISEYGAKVDSHKGHRVKKHKSTTDSVKNYNQKLRGEKVLDRKKGTDPDSIYDEDFIDYLGVGLFWFIAIPILIFAYIANSIKTICIFIVETKIALETDEEEQEEEEHDS